MKQPTETKRFTREQFTTEIRRAGILGAWTFWRQIKDCVAKTGESFNEAASGILCALVAKEFLESGPPRSPQEQEMFEDLLPVARTPSTATPSTQVLRELTKNWGV